MTTLPIPQPSDEAVGTAKLPKPVEKPDHLSTLAILRSGNYKEQKENKRKFSMNYQSYETTDLEAEEKDKRMLRYMFPGYQTRDPRDWHEKETQCEVAFDPSKGQRLWAEKHDLTEYVEKEASVEKISSREEYLMVDEKVRSCSLAPHGWVGPPLTAKLKAYDFLFLEVANSAKNPRLYKMHKKAIEQSTMEIRVVPGPRYVPQMVVTIGGEIIFPEGKHEMVISNQMIPRYPSIIISKKREGRLKANRNTKQPQEDQRVFRHTEFQSRAEDANQMPLQKHEIPFPEEWTDIIRLEEPILQKEYHLNEYLEADEDEEDHIGHIKPVITILPEREEGLCYMWDKKKPLSTFEEGVEKEDLVVYNPFTDQIELRPAMETDNDDIHLELLAHKLQSEHNLLTISEFLPPEASVTSEDEDEPWMDEDAERRHILAKHSIVPHEEPEALKARARHGSFFVRPEDLPDIDDEDEYESPAPVIISTEPDDNTYSIIKGVSPPEDLQNVTKVELVKPPIEASAVDLSAETLKPPLSSPSEEKLKILSSSPTVDRSPSPSPGRLIKVESPPPVPVVLQEIEKDKKSNLVDRAVSPVPELAIKKPKKRLKGKPETSDKCVVTMVQHKDKKRLAPEKEPEKEPEPVAEVPLPERVSPFDKDMKFFNRSCQVEIERYTPELVNRSCGSLDVKLPLTGSFTMLDAARQPSGSPKKPETEPIIEETGPKPQVIIESSFEPSLIMRVLKEIEKEMEPVKELATQLRAISSSSFPPQLEQSKSDVQRKPKTEPDAQGLTPESSFVKQFEKDLAALSKKPKKDVPKGKTLAKKPDTDLIHASSKKQWKKEYFCPSHGTLIKGGVEVLDEFTQPEPDHELRKCTMYDPSIHKINKTKNETHEPSGTSEANLGAKLKTKTETDEAVGATEANPGAQSKPITERDDPMGATEANLSAKSKPKTERDEPTGATEDNFDVKLEPKTESDGPPGATEGNLGAKLKTKTETDGSPSATEANLGAKLKPKTQPDEPSGATEAYLGSKLKSKTETDAPLEATEANLFAKLKSKPNKTETGGSSDRNEPSGVTEVNVSAKSKTNRDKNETDELPDGKKSSMSKKSKINRDQIEPDMPPDGQKSSMSKKKPFHTKSDNKFQVPKFDPVKTAPFIQSSEMFPNLLSPALSSFSLKIKGDEKQYVDSKPEETQNNNDTDLHQRRSASLIRSVQSPRIPEALTRSREYKEESMEPKFDDTDVLQRRNVSLIRSVQSPRIPEALTRSREYKEESMEPKFDDTDVLQRRNVSLIRSVQSPRIPEALTKSREYKEESIEPNFDDTDVHQRRNVSLMRSVQSPRIPEDLTRSREYKEESKEPKVDDVKKQSKISDILLEIQQEMVPVKTQLDSLKTRMISLDTINHLKPNSKDQIPTVKRHSNDRQHLIRKPITSGEKDQDEDLSQNSSPE